MQNKSGGDKRPVPLSDEHMIPSYMAPTIVGAPVPAHERDTARALATSGEGEMPHNLPQTIISRRPGRVKGGKVQTEQMCSGLHLKADARRSREKNRSHSAIDR